MLMSFLFSTGVWKPIFEGVIGSSDEVFFSSLVKFYVSKFRVPLFGCNNVLK